MVRWAGQRGSRLCAAPAGLSRRLVIDVPPVRPLLAPADGCESEPPPRRARSRGGAAGAVGPGAGAVRHARPVPRPVRAPARLPEVRPARPAWRARRRAEARPCEGLGSEAWPLEGPRCAPRLARRGNLEVALVRAAAAAPPPTQKREGPLQGPRASRPGRAGAGGTTRRTAGGGRRARCTARPRRRWTATRRWCWIQTRWRRTGLCRRPAMRSAGTGRSWRTARPGARVLSLPERARRGRPGAWQGIFRACAAEGQGGCSGLRARRRRAGAPQHHAWVLLSSAARSRCARVSRA